MRVDLVEFHGVEAFGQLGCLLFLGELLDHHWIDDVPRLFVQFSEANVCIILEVDHQLGLDLKDVCPALKFFLPLLLPFCYDCFNMGNNLFLVNLLLDFSGLLEFGFETSHQFLGLHSQVLLQWGKLANSLLVGG